MARAPAKIRRRKHPRIDVHTHVALPQVLAEARKIKVRSKAPGTQHWVPQESQAEHARQSADQGTELNDPKARLRDMDRMGIDIQVISMNIPTPVYWAAPRTGLKVCRVANEGVAEFIAADPDRFVGIGAVPLQDAAVAADELAHLVNDLGLRGAIVPSHIQGHDLGEARFRPFWAKAEALGVPIYVHPRGFTHDARLHKYFLWNSIGQPLEEALAMSSLIHEGVMDAFPKLKIIIAHGGGYLPYYPGRADRSFHSRPEPRQHIDREPSQYMKRFWYDSTVFDRDMLEMLVRRVGAGRVMMGTDYPRGEIEEDPVGFVTRTRALGADDRRKIMSGNAAKLFGLKL